MTTPLGPNSTGTPDTRDYTLGRGICYFAPLNDDGTPGAYRDMGNAPECTITTSVTTLKHETSRSGLKITDQEVTITEGVELKVKLDELNHENLAIYFSGDEVAVVNPTVAGFASYQMIQGLQLGRFYDIVDSTGNRAYDVQAADLHVNDDSSSTDLVLDPAYDITKGGEPATGTDYALDSEMGRIFFFDPSTNAAEGDNIHVRLVARANAGVVEEVTALQEVSVLGALKFVSENTANDGKRREFQFHKIRLKANGDLALISDTYTTMDFSGAAERNTSLPGSPTLTIRTVTPTAA